MDEILNSNSLNDVRFRMSKPQGYYAEDVDKFVDEQVKSSLAAYELQIKEMQASVYALESQLKEQEDELSTLRMKSDFSRGNALVEEDNLLQDAVQKQETLELENSQLRQSLQEWQQYAAAVEEVLNQANGEQPQTVEPATEEAAENFTPQPETQPEPQPYVETEPYTPQPIMQPEPVAQPEPTTPTQSGQTQPAPTSPETETDRISATDKALEDIMLSVESEISEDELKAVLAEVGEETEDERYLSADEVKPEDL